MATHREFYYSQAQQTLSELFNRGEIDHEFESRMLRLEGYIVRMMRETSINSNISPQPGTRTVPQIHHNPQIPREISKVIPKKKLEELCPDECAICQEIPKYKNCLYTECKHFYCKSCWDCWMNTETSNKTCPVCRAQMTKTTTYKARESRRQTIMT
jgi:hypothetical protein